jgi:hypothetical protein
MLACPPVPLRETAVGMRLWMSRLIMRHVKQAATGQATLSLLASAWTVQAMPYRPQWCQFAPIAGRRSPAPDGPP